MKNSCILKSFIAVTVIVFLFSSCGWGHRKPAPTGKNIICAVDFSDSKNAAERLLFYKNVIKNNIIPKLGMYDKITVIPIDKASITNSVDLFFNDLSATAFVPENASPVDEEQLTKDNLQKYIDALRIEFEKSFQDTINSRSKSEHGTDIFGALEIAQKKFKGTKDNYLILLSDMMNWSPALNMEPDNKGFNLGTMDNILNKVPNYEMPNTTALVLTAEQVEVTPEHFKLVDSFWTKYCERNHIKLYDYNSAMLTKLDELMALPIAKKQLVDIGKE